MIKGPNSGVSGIAVGKEARLVRGTQHLNLGEVVTKIGDNRVIDFGGHKFRVELREAAACGKQIVVEPEDGTPLACSVNSAISVGSIFFRPNMAKTLPPRNGEAPDENDWIMIQSDGIGSSSPSPDEPELRGIPTVH